MAGPGGARPGAGRPKGQTKLIRIQSLREAVDARLPKPFVEIFADVILKWNNEIHTGDRTSLIEGSKFMMNALKLMLEPVPAVVENVSNVETKTEEELQAEYQQLKASMKVEIIAEYEAEKLKDQIIQDYPVVTIGQGDVDVHPQ